MKNTIPCSSDGLISSSTLNCLIFSSAVDTDRNDRLPRNRTSDSRSSLSQCLPVRPAGQSHSYPAPTGTHVDPSEQLCRFASQELYRCEHTGPNQPSSHTHLCRTVFFINIFTECLFQLRKNLNRYVIFLNWFSVPNFLQLHIKVLVFSVSIATPKCNYNNNNNNRNYMVEYRE